MPNSFGTSIQQLMAEQMRLHQESMARDLMREMSQLQPDVERTIGNPSINPRVGNRTSNISVNSVQAMEPRLEQVAPAEPSGPTLSSINKLLRGSVTSRGFQGAFSLFGGGNYQVIAYKYEILCIIGDNQSIKINSDYPDDEYKLAVENYASETGKKFWYVSGDRISEHIKLDKLRHDNRCRWTRDGSGIGSRTYASASWEMAVPAFFSTDDDIDDDDDSPF